MSNPVSPTVVLLGRWNALLACSPSAARRSRGKAHFAVSWLGPVLSGGMVSIGQVQVLSDHIEKLMMFLKHEATQKAKAHEQQRRLQKELELVKASLKE